MSRSGKVYLLGAGPGDPELITRRAVQRLKEADVVLYDALVHPDVLRHCALTATKIFVGKRAGRVSERQSQINERMKDAAKKGLTVARLKGGDPFLFGRGSEEAEFLAEEHIPFEVVPGVPSPIAAAAYTGISLTHRDLASSIAYITATESPEKDETAHDWAKLATATQTLVIFMGMRRLDSLMRLLIEHGRPSNTPVAVVQSASLPTQKTVIGTVEDIAAKASAEGVSMPALTIVGPVVRLHDSLAWFEHQPLFGKRVLITRPEAQSDTLATLLRDRGADPIEAPTIHIEPPVDSAGLDQAIAELDQYSWIIFTSQNGVDFFFDRLKRMRKDARALGRARVAAIGPVTAEALCAHGVHADVIPEEYVGESVAEALLKAHKGPIETLRALLPRAEVAREALVDKLRERGATVDVVIAYRTCLPGEPQQMRIRELLIAHKVDVVTFTSSSTVRNCMQILGTSADDILQSCVIGSIGPITTHTAQELGVRVDVTATEYTVSGLVNALETYFSASEVPR